MGIFNGLFNNKRNEETIFDHTKTQYAPPETINPNLESIDGITLNELLDNYGDDETKEAIKESKDPIEQLVKIRDSLIEKYLIDTYAKEHIGGYTVDGKPVSRKALLDFAKGNRKEYLKSRAETRIEEDAEPVNPPQSPIEGVFPPPYEAIEDLPPELDLPPANEWSSSQPDKDETQ